MTFRFNFFTDTDSYLFRCVLFLLFNSDIVDKMERQNITANKYPIRVEILIFRAQYSIKRLLWYSETCVNSRIQLRFHQRKMWPGGTGETLCVLTPALTEYYAPRRPYIPFRHYKIIIFWANLNFYTFRRAYIRGFYVHLKGKYRYGNFVMSTCRYWLCY